MDRVALPFSDRVAHYLRCRPNYPPAVLDLLIAEGGLMPTYRVADVGSGTGLLSRLFLAYGNVVLGVEPDPEMRRAAASQLGGHPNFVSVAATAEATALAPQSVDLVTVGQAFHWFDPHRAYTEFRRILQPGGWVALVWNERRREASPFMRAYESLVDAYALPRGEAPAKHPVDLPALFGPGLRERQFAHRQTVDFAGLRGRLLSSSYAPLEDHPRHRPMMEALRALHAAHQEEGNVTFEYTTRVYYVRL